jgi:hypothetical protein
MEKSLWLAFRALHMVFSDWRCSREANLVLSMLFPRAGKHLERRHWFMQICP